MRRLVLPCLLALVTACSRPTGTLVEGRQPWTEPHVLRIADTTDPDRLNPYLSVMDLVYNLTSLMYSYLVIADDRGQLIGDLARSVPTQANGGISRDGLTYTYRLHRGVYWHDGRLLTSHDVVRSWQAVLDPRNNTLHREGYDQVASIDAPDAYTVVVHLKHRYPPFVSQFFAPLQEGGKPILPAHILDRESSFNTGLLNDHPIGSGPFKFVKWERGNVIVLQRFDKYFKGKPALERVEVHIVPNDQTVYNEVALHRIDLVISPSEELYQRYRALSNVRVELFSKNAQRVLVFNAARPALRDVTVRQAIAHAIDYDALILNVSRGAGEVAQNSLPATAIGYAPLPPHAYDPAEARRLLRGRHIALTLSIKAGDASLAAIALQIQQYLHAVGIDARIKPVPQNQLFALDGPIYSGSYDMASFSTALAWDPDVHFYLDCNQMYPHGSNTFRYCNPSLDKLEEAGLQTEDPLERATIYERASRIIWDDVPYLPLYNLRRVTVESTDLKNFSVNASATPFWNAWQWDI